QSSVYPHFLPSFPTRRSSDLPPYRFRRVIGSESPLRPLPSPAVEFGGRTQGSPLQKPIFIGHAAGVFMSPFSDARARIVLILLRSEEHTSELQSQSNIVCRLL